MFAFFSSIATLINTVVNFVINFFVTLMMVIVCLARPCIKKAPKLSFVIDLVFSVALIGCLAYIAYDVEGVI